MDSDTQTREIIQTARTGHPELYTAALLAPRDRKKDLITLAAFVAEIERIGAEVSEPHLAEIRLQWWRDAIEATDPQTRFGHAVLDEMRGVLQRNGILPDALEEFFDAYAESYYPQPPQDIDDFRARLQAMFTTPFELTRMILDLPATPQGRDALRLGGESYGAMRLAIALPIHLIRGRTVIPEQEIDSSGESPARQMCSWLVHVSRNALSELAQMPQGNLREFLPAMLPVAVVEPHLNVLQRNDHEPDRDIAEIAPLTRLWRMYRARNGGHLFKGRK